MIVIHLFAQRVTGVTNIKPIMRSECVIVAMLFIVKSVMKWISAKIVERSCAEGVELFAVVNFVGVVFVKIVPQLVDGECLMFFDPVLVACASLRVIRAGFAFF